MKWKLKIEKSVALLGVLALNFTNSSSTLAANCDPSPSGIISWWTGEGSDVEIFSGSNGVIRPGVTFTTGMVGQCFSFDGISGCVLNANTPPLTNIHNSFTMEFWAYPKAGIVMVKTDGSQLANSGQQFAIFPDYGAYNAQAGAGVSVGTNGISVIESAPYYLPSVLNYTNVLSGWVHVAVVYLNKQPSLYVNGINVATGVTSTRTFVYPSKDFGGSIVTPWNTYGPYKGLLDEVSIYNRALAASEIAAIYVAGSGGKCLPQFPPTITSQPVGQTNYAGTTAIFSVAATGTAPLSYLWFFGANPLSQQTNATLVLSNVQPSQAGTYSVLVSNANGATNSMAALLAVNPLPSCDPSPSGMVSWWPGEWNATDLIGGSNGVINSGVTFTNGMVGHCFCFDGVSGCVMNNNTPPLTNIQNSFTIEFWAYPMQSVNLLPEGGAQLANSGQSYAVFPNYGGGNGQAGVGVSVGTNGISVIEHAAGYLPSELSYTNFLSGWVHVAVVYINKRPTLYVNGVNLRTGITSTRTFVYPSKDFGSSTDSYSGIQYNGYGPYKGLLDEISIYDHALASADIAAIYNAGPGGKCPVVIPSRSATGAATNISGFVTGVNLTDGGYGYTNTPLVHFNGGGGTGAAGYAVVSNGVVISITITNAGYGYTNAPVVVIAPPYISEPVLGIAPMSFLIFSNLTVGGIYQLQRSMAWYWTNQPVTFTSTNALYTQMVAGAAGGGEYRLAINPVPAQAFASPQVVNGFFVGAVITSGGSGYVTSPAVSVVGGRGTNATAVATISGGVVTSITAINPGSGYTNAPTVQIAPPPAAAVFPTVLPVMRVDSASLVPYANNYQIQFKPDLHATWVNWNGGLFLPTDVTNSQFIFITNGIGFFRLQYTP